MMATPTDRVVAALEAAGCAPRQSGNGWSARCPAHQDRRASLTVAAGADGRALVRCHAGCSADAVTGALGLAMADLFPRDPTRGNGKAAAPAANGRAFPTADAAVAALVRKHGPPAAQWTYHNATGEPVGLVLRWDGPAGKDIRPLARHADGWRIAAMPEPRPLYRLPALLAAAPDVPVVVTEGEKTADAAARCGLLATTSAGGARAAKKTDWSPVAGRRVVVLPDNDDAGDQYAQDVAALCHAAGAADVRILRLADHAPGLAAGGDLANVVAAYDWHGVPLGEAALPEDFAAWLVAAAEALDPWRPAGQVEADELRFRPFPVTALPEPLRGFVTAAAEAIGCDPSFIALPLLAACAAAIGNTRRLRLKRGWLVPPIVWAVIVGESGSAKTPAMQLATRHVYERQRKAFDDYGAALAAHQLACRRKARGEPEPEPPKCVRYVVTDTTIEALAVILRDNPRGVLLSRDELAGWISSFDRYTNRQKASADATTWASMFNAMPITVDRQTSEPRTIHIVQAAVCVTGGIQPGILRRALSVEHRENGLAARLLVACPPRRPKRWTEADIDAAIEAAVAQVIDRLLELAADSDDDGNLRPRLVNLSHDAKAAWIAYYETHNDEQVDLAGDLAAAWSKLDEYAARLALVVHYVRWAAGEVLDENTLDADSMAASITLANWFKYEARRLYATLDESDDDRDRRRLVEWLERRGGVATPREVQRALRGLREAGAAEAALEALVAAGLGTWEQVAGQKGRPARRFRVLSPPDRDTAKEDEEWVMI
jgi:hypothetical protein